MDPEETYFADDDDSQMNSGNDDPEDVIDLADITGPTDPMKDYEAKKKTYKTTPVLTKYEKTRILGQRSNQIINGSKPMIQNPEDYHNNPYDIALQELKQKKIPFIIKRPYGNTFEYWKLEDLY
jgi:DNA-directed RNA polymerase subunit K/omega